MAAVIDKYIQELTQDEGWALLDRQAQRQLGMSGEEFVRTWESGGFDGKDDAAVIDVSMLLPFGR